MVLGRIVSDRHDNGLKITKSQGSPTYVANHHNGDIGVESGDGRWREFAQ